MATKVAKSETQHLLDENDMKPMLVDINSVLQWKNNTNTHDKKSLEKLAAGIKKHGQWRPAVVWRGDRQIRIGNGMHLAMRDILGYKKIWVIYKDFQNAAEADLAGTFDNKAGEWSERDEDKLRDLFAREDVIALSGQSRKQLEEFSGFTEAEIRGIFLEPDFDRIEKIGADNVDLLSTIKITCKPTDKKEIVETLSQWFGASGFEGLEIK